MMHPHCDQRILHGPGECEYCDEHPEWQRLRVAWGIAFTGQIPATGDILNHGNRSPGHVHPVPTTRQYTVLVPAGEHRAMLPCPADFNRPPTGEGSDHRRWAGNVATTQAPVNETPTSQMLYGEHPVDRKMRLAREIAEARQRPGFVDRLRANVERHRPLLDRLRDR